MKAYTLLVTVDDNGIDIAAEVRPDTVLVERDVPVDVLVPVPAKGTPWAWPAAVAVGLIALWGIVRELRRFRRKK